MGWRGLGIGIFSCLLCGSFRSGLPAQVAINEFLASNHAGILDEDGAASDWIEIYNAGPARDLAGWFLTDDPALLSKWRFPSVPLSAGGYLLVFASGKDRARAGSELHTNFKLSSQGEYLALVRPDGLTPEEEFAPAYPPQFDDVAYGAGIDAESLLIAAGAAARVLVPADDSLSTSWTGAGEPFDDSEAGGWTLGTTGLGYDQATETVRPLAYFSFDDAADADVALDSSGNRNHGVITSHFELTGQGGGQRPVYSPDGGGHSGMAGDRALDFGLRGNGALVKVPAAELGAFDAATQRDAITLSLWIFGSADQPANDSVFWGSSNPDGTGIRSLNAHIPWSDSTIYWDTAGCCDSTQRIQKPASDPSWWKGRWNHYLFLKDGDRKQIWRNGVLFHEGTNTADLTSIRGLFIGGSENNGDLSYGGLIDDFAVWGEALSESEIAALARGDSPLGLSGLRPLLGTDLSQAMKGRNGSVYIRIPFAVEGPAGWNSLRLRMKYDAGFVAYLNGVEVARRNAPPAPAFDSTATAQRPRQETLSFEEIDLTSELGLLRAGANLLAIHGLNDARDSPDFLILPELLAARTAPGRYLLPPTPGGRNGAGVQGFVGEVAFQVEHGFFSDPFSVELQEETPGAAIWITTDGSRPDPANPAARPYAGPIEVKSTTTLSAAAFKEGFQPSPTATRSYIFPAAVARQPAFPPGLPRSWSGGFPADYGVDSRVVNTTRPGYGFEEALLAIPTVSLTLPPEDLFGADHGIYFNSFAVEERGASFEFIEPGGGPGLQADAGLRIHGYTSRDHGFTPKHSFRVVFKSRYGPPKLVHPLFPDSEVERFDQVVLRGMSTDSWPVSDGWPSPTPGVLRWYRERAQYLREQWMKDSQIAMGNLSTHGIFVHLYLNGLYWGLYNLTERPTDSFNAEHLGGRKDEYDVLKDFAEVQAGNGDAWNQMMALASSGLATDAAYQRIQGNNPDGSRNAALPRYLDLDNLIDYMILHIYAGADDWPNHNWWTGRRRGPESEGFKFFVWDQEITNTSLTETRTSWGTRFEEVSAYNSPAYLYAQLRANGKFRRRFADRVQKHLFGAGALSPEASAARWGARAEEVDQAIVGESARWGDSKRAVPYKREVEWLQEQVWLQEVYFPGIQPVALERFRRAGLYPAVAAPVLNRYGGRVAPGFELTLSAASGEIRYTLNGPDPELEGGGVSPAALLHSGDPIPIAAAVTVRARALDHGVWSALVEAGFFEDIPLRVTEIMYHPADPPTGSGFRDEDFEFIEVQNVGREPLDLRGMRFDGAIQFDFAAGPVISLPPRRLLVVARNREGFRSRYGPAIPLAGSYLGGLKNSSGAVLLLGPAGERILDFRYSDRWYPETDGGGASLVIRDPLGDPDGWGRPEEWRASTAPRGTPGVDESGGPPPPGFQRAGDLNQDGALNLSDPIALLSLLFIDGTLRPPCGPDLGRGGNLVLLDANGDGRVDLADPVALLEFLFLGGPAPAPGLQCAPVEDCPDACAG